MLWEEFKPLNTPSPLAEPVCHRKFMRDKTTNLKHRIKFILLDASSSVVRKKHEILHCLKGDFK